jgi:hypothetical protein
MGFTKWKCGHHRLVWKLSRSRAAQFVESERRTAANTTCVMPATPATRNVRSVASREHGPMVIGRRAAEKGRKADPLVGPIGRRAFLPLHRDFHPLWVDLTPSATSCGNGRYLRVPARWKRRVAVDVAVPVGTAAKTRAGKLIGVEVDVERARSTLR